MASITFSKSVRAAAKRFLSDYHLAFDQLTAAQQKQVVTYIRVRKWWPWLLLSFLVVIIALGFCALGEYHKMQNIIEKTAVIADSGTEIDWPRVSRFSLMQGFIIGVYTFIIIYMFLLTIFVPKNIHSQKRMLDAFLPSVTSKPIDESNQQN